MKMHDPSRSAVVAVLLALVSVAAFGQGSMTPPTDAFGTNGVPKAFMKTLDQIEPRTPILSIPYTITNAGSFYLIKTLKGPGGITIESNDVQLDLSGFALEGLGRPPAGGVYISGQRQNIEVRNGVLRAWGQAGIDGPGAHESRYINVIAFTNGGDGLVIGRNSLIKDCGAFKNSANGISAGSGATVLNVKSRENQAFGVQVGEGSKVSESILGNNLMAGVFASDSCTIRDCTVIYNGTDGIGVDSNCRVENNNCSQNWNGAGVQARRSGNRLVQNTVNYNKFGIQANAGSSSNNVVVKNSASGNSSANYSVNQDANAFGTRRVGSGYVTVTTGPWANFDL